MLHLDDGGSGGVGSGGDGSGGGTGGGGGEIVFHDPRATLSCSGAGGDWKKKLFFLCTWCKEPTCPAKVDDVAWQTTPLLWDNAGVSASEPPQPGKLQLWPAWLPHEVLPHAGPRPRLALAFNVWVAAAAADSRGGAGNRKQNSGQREATLSPATAKQQKERVAAFMKTARNGKAGGGVR